MRRSASLFLACSALAFACSRSARSVVPEPRELAHASVDGVELPVRPNLGIYTQPISFIGLPVVAAPVPLSPLPIGVQIIAPPWREEIALRVSYALEQAGVAVAPKPSIDGAI